MIETKVTADELKRAKDTWLKDQDTSLSNDDYVMNSLASQMYRGRTFAFTKEFRSKLAALTADDIVRVAKKYLDPKRLTIVEAGDQSKAKK